MENLWEKSREGVEFLLASGREEAETQISESQAPVDCEESDWAEGEVEEGKTHELVSLLAWTPGSVVCSSSLLLKALAFLQVAQVVLI